MKWRKIYFRLHSAANTKQNDINIACEHDRLDRKLKL